MATTAKTEAASTSKSKIATGSTQNGNQIFLFDKTNYTWMIAGVVLILLGIFLMAGGKSADPHQFNYDEIYSFRRITLAPVLMMIGFAVEVYAIMKKPANKD